MLRRHLSVFIAIGVWSAVCAADESTRGGPSSTSEPSPLTFESHVRPILKEKCFLCHGEEAELEGNLDVRLVRLLIRGGDSGPALLPEHPDESLMLQRIVSGEMPPGDKKLSTSEIDVIRRWIKQGAKTARPEPADVAQAKFTDEERSHWSFQPLTAPAVPTVRNDATCVRTPIDAFLSAKLEAAGLGFSPEADAATLCRRLYFDLIGLPPTPEETAEFVRTFVRSDATPQSATESERAYAALIEKLLASPHYGERWGRHWLDVAGYADSDGYGELDLERPFAYKYRDYVIRAFNDDKPFDEFIREQLAGDELVRRPFADLSPTEADRLIATGFLRSGPDGTGDPAVDRKAAANEVLAETIKIVSTSLLGLSVGCAQCHDHRFDPISHDDYFRLRALFEPAYDPQAWRTPNERLVSLWTSDEQRRADDIDSELKKLADERTQSLVPQYAELLAAELAKLPDEVRSKIEADVRYIVLPGDKQPTDAQRALLKKYPRLRITESSIRRHDPDRFQKELKAYEARVAAVKERAPTPNFVQALTETPGHVPKTFLFKRGDYNQPAHEVEPGELSVLTHGVAPIVSSLAPDAATSGRRLMYARHLTDGRHPLVARVLVNRFWMHHFGQGIVATPAEFGVQGDRPSHPELLDWLAGEFVRSGWKSKQLHRLIVTSTAYRQSSRRTDELDRVDPENRLLGRMNLRRLEAETIRDSVLAISGQLKDKMYGPPLPVAPDGVGQVVVGVKASSRDGRVNSLKDGEGNRRSVYVQARRSLPLAILETFDSPTMVPNCEIRSSSTVTPQALLLMNNDFIVRQSEVFAERVLRETENEPAAGVRRAWMLALNREPTAAQLARANEFLAVQERHLSERTPPTASTPPAKFVSSRPTNDLRFQALANFCQFLLSNNGFLYVD